MRFCIKTKSGLVYRLVVEHLHSMYEVPGSIPSTKEKSDHKQKVKRGRKKLKEGWDKAQW